MQLEAKFPLAISTVESNVPGEQASTASDLPAVSRPPDLAQPDWGELAANSARFASTAESLVEEATSAASKDVCQGVRDRIRRCGNLLRSIVAPCMEQSARETQQER